MSDRYYRVTINDAPELHLDDSRPPQTKGVGVIVCGEARRRASMPYPSPIARLISAPGTVTCTWHQSFPSTSEGEVAVAPLAPLALYLSAD